MGDVLEALPTTPKGRIRALCIPGKRGRKPTPANYPLDVIRPTTRGDCEGGERPCRWVSCRHHLFLDVTSAGNLKLNFPHLEPDELEESCSLDVAASGGRLLEEVGGLMNLTRERIRQFEVDASNHMVDGMKRFKEPT